MTGTSTTFWGAMTTAEIAALSAPQPGDRAYDTDEDMIVRYDGTTWLEELHEHQITEITDGGTAPGTSKTGGITTRDFDDGGVNASEDVDQGMVVPQNYVTGKRLSLRAIYSSNDTGGGRVARISTITDLYQPDAVIGTPSDTVTDALRAVSVSGAANTQETVDIPLTTVAGLVNLTAVAPGDFLRLNFLRQGNDAGDSMVGDMRLWSWTLIW